MGTRQMDLAYMAWEKVQNMPTIIKASWKNTGLLPLDRTRLSSVLKHRYAPRSTVHQYFEEIRDLVANCEEGKEADALNNIFRIASKIAPVYQLLDDLMQRDHEGRCSACGRKQRTPKLSLQNLHDGCCLTADDVVQQVEEVTAAREEKKQADQ